MSPPLRLDVPPEEAAGEPDLSIVIPALNEALTITEFVDWCLEGLRGAGIRGEVLIVDSSSDGTGDLALARGARVLRAPKRGLGRAYIDALPFARGRWLVLGDCDLTYDFRHLKPFVEAFEGGAEYVMGSRFKGYIEPGAMPALHRYFGTPVTTQVLNLIYGSRFSDIHCGMRGITREGLERMQLRSQGWEYASEMVLKAVKLGLRAQEVPIRFYKDREGRLSHHKRSGFLSPWLAGWDNLRAMFLYGADFFLLRPGLVLLALGLALVLPVVGGPWTLGPVTFSLYWMLLGCCLAVAGLQAVYMGILAQCVSDLKGESLPAWTRRWTYDRGVWSGGALVAFGAAAGLPLIKAYLDQGLHLGALGPANYLAVLGLMLGLMGFFTFTFTLVLHGLGLNGTTKTAQAELKPPKE